MAFLTSSAVRFPTTLPAIAPWPQLASAPSPFYTQIIDPSTKLCWDAQVAHAGAQITLTPCLAVTNTQMFEVTTANLQTGQVVLSINQGPSLKDLDSGKLSLKKLCVGLASDSTLRVRDP
jgi:hypothetical protein